MATKPTTCKSCGKLMVEAGVGVASGAFALNRKKERGLYCSKHVPGGEYGNHIVSRVSEGHTID